MVQKFPAGHFIQNGRDSATKRQLVSSTPELHDFIIVSEPPAVQSKDVLHQKYVVENLSAAQIARDLGCSKTTVKKYLKEFTLRKSRPNGLHKKNAPLGIKIEKGKPKRSVKEAQLKEAIVEMHQNQGLSTYAIAKVLSQMKIPTKQQGKKWDHSVVRRILQNEGAYKPSERKKK